MKDDTQIEQYISQALGIYSTGPRLSSILRVIKSATVTDKLFNMNSVINFINGTLELTETEPFYSFREHSASDLCTYCLDYPYIPTATSPEWQTFIDTVTECLQNGEYVHISGFATFDVKDKNAREGVNPQNSEPIIIPACKAPVVKFSKSYKELFNK
jgi:DNA-binding protein HU-beta